MHKPIAAKKLDVLKTREDVDSSKDKNVPKEKKLSKASKKPNEEK